MTKSDQRRVILGVLSHLWDPVGVSERPDPLSEYRSYVGTLLDDIQRQGDVDRLTRTLSRLRTQELGCPENARRDRETARALLSILGDVRGRTD